MAAASEPIIQIPEVGQAVLVRNRLATIRAGLRRIMPPSRKHLSRATRARAALQYSGKKPCRGAGPGGQRLDESELQRDAVAGSSTKAESKKMTVWLPHSQHLTVAHAITQATGSVGAIQP